MTPTLAATILLYLIGSLSLSGAIGRAFSRADRLAGVQALIGWVCLSVLAGLTWSLSI